LILGPRNLELNEGERWYAVQSLPNREFGVCLQLANQGWRSFLPRIRKTRRHARKAEIILAPFYPRYLFVILDMKRDQWRSVNGTFGVSQLVMQNERPLALPRGVIEDIIVCTREDGLLSFDGERRLKAGQKVELLDGPFAKQLGIIEHMDSHERVRLLLDMMGCKVRVNLSGGDVLSAA
jgi:transcriptional antiterminator RfaH